MVNKPIIKTQEEPSMQQLLKQIQQQYEDIDRELKKLQEFHKEMAPYMFFIKHEYEKKQETKAKWKRAFDAALGWGVISLLSIALSLVGFLGHYFWHSLKRDLGLK